MRQVPSESELQSGGTPAGCLDGFREFANGMQPLLLLGVRPLPAHDASLLPAWFVELSAS